MKTEQNKRLDLWTAVTLAAAALLILNFIAFCILSVTGIGRALDPVTAIITAIFLLLGMAVYFWVKRRAVAKRWLRTLLGAILGNFLIIALYCAAAALLMAYLVQ